MENICLIQRKKNMVSFQNFIQNIQMQSIKNIVST